MLHVIEITVLKSLDRAEFFRYILTAHLTQWHTVMAAGRPSA
jgi:hypothetical protein